MSADMLVFPHPDYTCIYEDIAANILRFFNRESLLEHLSYCYTHGIKTNIGLYDGGFLIRNHNRSLIKKTMEDWYDECIHHSLRDQFSLPYVIERNGLNIDLIELNTSCSGYYVVRPHCKGANVLC